MGNSEVSTIYRTIMNYFFTFTIKESRYQILELDGTVTNWWPVDIVHLSLYFLDTFVLKYKDFF